MIFEQKIRNRCLPQKKLLRITRTMAKMRHFDSQVMDFDRKLDRQIADLDDIRIIMETQKKIRDQEIDIDMKIDLVEEAFSLLAKYV